MTLAILPRVFSLNDRIDGNALQHLADDFRQIEVNVATYTSGRVKGWVLRPIHDASEPILVTNTLGSISTDYRYVLRLRQASIEPNQNELDLANAVWLKHPLTETDLCHPVRIVRSWHDAFRYVAENGTKGTVGLRTPQIGAVHMVHGHWTTSNSAATIVMPTGTGKTDTMLAIMVSTPCDRILVIVPTDALRTQLAEKFLTLGILKHPKSRLLASKALRPIVATLRHKPKTAAEVDKLFELCNVVITTSHIAGQSPNLVQARMAYQCPYLFIDEAHHTEAPTWKAFKEHFSDKKVLQFTATPFREDGTLVDGRVIYKYPLRKAQEENYFRPIKFAPVIEFNPKKTDAAIADRAIQCLRDDLPLKHILMARVGSIQRAHDVIQIYKRYEEFAPVELHTGIKSAKEREAIRRQIISGKCRVIVCVDMLGEGFDLPELKIAAFHDIRKSLPVTLQLAGRFTRPRSDVGDATFIANIADIDVQDELRKLYARDPDWNILLPELSENAIGEQVRFQDFAEGFSAFPEEFPLRSIRPAASTVVYKTACDVWQPHRFKDGLIGLGPTDKVYSDVNYSKNTLIAIVGRKVPIPWAEIEDITDLEWTLYIVVWEPNNELLFIHSSNNSGVFRRLAKAIGGEDVQLISGQQVFRALAGINRLKLQNVGLTEQRGRLIRYTGRMGTDVGPGLSQAQKQRAQRAVLSGSGFQHGRRVSMGASRKGRIWSVRRPRVDGLVDWCHSAGRKLLDDTINPEDVLEGTLESTIISQMPASTPIAIDWPEVVYSEPEAALQITFSDAQTAHPYEASIDLTAMQPEGDICFSICSDSNELNATLELFEHADRRKDYRFVCERGLFATFRGRTMSLEDFLYEHPPIIWFANGASLEGNAYTPLKLRYSPYDRNKIISWDWSDTDVSIESQGLTKIQNSIQRTVIERLLADGKYEIVFDDDGKGEAADVVALFTRGGTRRSREICVEFYHCKYSKGVGGRRIGDLYEVCGQAQKSVRWMSNGMKQVELFTHLLRRDAVRLERGCPTRFEHGDADRMVALRDMAYSCAVSLSIFVVQPGLSRSKASSEQLELLSVTDNYLLETYKLPFSVIAGA